jgi:hypothetical protein
MPRQILDLCFFDDGSFFSRFIYLAHLLFVAFFLSFFFSSIRQAETAEISSGAEKRKEEGKKKKTKVKK